MLTDRDKKIVKYVEDYGFITISQCADIWMNECKFGSDIARKRLSKIVKAGYLKNNKLDNTISSEKVFYIDNKYMKPTKSMIVSMDVFAELKRLGADIIYFNREEHWLDDKYRSDAFAIFKLDKFLFSCCIEVIDSTKLTYTNHKQKFIEKYTDIYNSGEPIQKIIEITNLKKNWTKPHLLIISEVNNSQLELPGANIIYLDYSLKKISQIFI